MTLQAQLAATLHAANSELAARITDRHFSRHPELEARYGPRGRTRCQEDAVFHLSYLAEAIAIGEPVLFARYVGWAVRTLRSRGIPAQDLRSDLVEMLDVVGETLPDVVSHVRVPIEQGLRALDVPDEEAASENISEGARRYLQAALREGPLEASRVVDELVASGMGAAEIYVDVLQGAMYEVGRLWQMNEMSVADEHYFTAVTQRIMARLYSDTIVRRPRGARVVVACVIGELHELGARMVSDLLELGDCQTAYLGASTPPAPLVDYVCQHGTRVLALSASTTPQLAQVRQTLSLLRADERCRDVKVIVGGGAFSALPSLWRIVGADAWAADARSAVHEIKRLQSA